MSNGLEKEKKERMKKSEKTKGYSASDIHSYSVFAKEINENQKIIECIKALSKIEGYTMSYEGMKRTGVLYDNIDLLIKYFDEKLKEI